MDNFDKYLEEMRQEQIKAEKACENSSDISIKGLKPSNITRTAINKMSESIKHLMNDNYIESSVEYITAVTDLLRVQRMLMNLVSELEKEGR